MTNMHLYRAFSALQMLLLATVAVGFAQEPPGVPGDLFAQQVPGIVLEDQTLVDGVAKLGQIVPISVSVEFPLTTTISSPATPQKKFKTNIGSGTVSEILDRLCKLNPTFTWVRFGNAANVYPRDLANDERYFLNRPIALLSFDNVPDAQKAVFAAVDQMPGPREQIAVLESGVSLGFAKPWTAKFQNLTLREALDKIALQLGPTYGWQLGGADNFRVITFHARLGVSVPRGSN